MSAQSRQVKGYLKPKSLKLVECYADEKDISKSEVVKLAVEHFFNNMSPAERLRLLNQVPGKKTHSKNSY